MEWKKPPAELAALLDKALATYPCQKRMMFGLPWYFVNGNMFTGLHQDDVILRLPADDRRTLLADWSGAAQFEPTPGRPMKEYMTMPESLYRDPERLDEWLTRSFEYAAALPPKQPKRKKQREPGN